MSLVIQALEVRLTLATKGLVLLGTRLDTYSRSIPFSPLQISMDLGWQLPGSRIREGKTSALGVLASLLPALLN